MVTQRRQAVSTVVFIDNDCQYYYSVFEDVRHFEAFKFLHLGILSEIKRKTLPLIAKTVGLKDSQTLHHSQAVGYQPSPDKKIPPTIQCGFYHSVEVLSNILVTQYSALRTEFCKPKIAVEMIRELKELGFQIKLTMKVLNAVGKSFLVPIF